MGDSVGMSRTTYMYTAFTLSPSSRVRLASRVRPGSWVLSPAFTHSPSSQSRLASRVRPVNYPQSSVENRVYGTVCVSAGPPPEVRNQSPGQTRLSVYTTKNCKCQTRLAGRILPFCWGRKGESDPPCRAGDLRLHWGKKASMTRLSGRTRELGLSVNAVITRILHKKISVLSPYIKRNEVISCIAKYYGKVT